ncbi:hypothetical protein [Candidatus Competibacter phosphatis]|nr:hypothetical protein [Candidatus Competibacter phosphatis]
MQRGALIADQAFLLPGGVIGVGRAYKAAVNRIGYTTNNYEAKHNSSSN